MFVLAIHSDKQHLQAVLAPKGIVLRQVNELWEIVPPPADGIKDGWIEILPGSIDHRVRSSKHIKVQSEQRLQINEIEFRRNFTIDKTRLEIRRFDSFGKMNSIQSVESQLSPLRDETVECLFRWNRDVDEDMRLATTLMVETFGCVSSGIARWDSTNQNWQVIAAAYRNKHVQISFDTRPLNQLLSDPSPHEYLSDKERLVFTPWFDGRGKLLGAFLGNVQVKEYESFPANQLTSQLKQLASIISTRQEQRDLHAQWNNRRRLLVESHDQQQEVSEQMILKSNSAQREGTALVLKLPDIQPDLNKFEELEKIMCLAAQVVSERHGQVVCFQSGKLTAIWEARHQPEHLTFACNAALDIIGRAEQTEMVNSKISVGLACGALIQNSYLGRRSYTGRAIRMAQRLAELAGELSLSILLADSPNREQLKSFDHRPLCRAKLLPNEVAKTLLQIGYHGDRLRDAEFERTDSEIFAVPTAVA